MKKLLLTIGLLVLPTVISPAMAQQKDLMLQVSSVEADLIWKGLRKLPVEEVETLMLKLRQQVFDQQNPKPEPKKDDDPK